MFRYDGSSWVEEQRLTPSDLSYGAEFGRSVAVSGDIAVVGAPQNSVRGSAYVFRYDGVDWVEEQQLTSSDISSGDAFGYAVAISGETLVVGARLDDDGGPSSGAMYVFRYDGGEWVEERKLTASDGSTGDLFGTSVAISGETVLAGAPFDGASGLGSGSAYAYTLPDIVAAEPEVVPAAFVTDPPAPNPASEAAALAFALDAPATVRLALYDVLGREVASVDAGHLGVGAHRLGLDVSSLPAGVYVWRLVASGRLEAGRLTVAR